MRLEDIYDFTYLNESKRPQNSLEQLNEFERPYSRTAAAKDKVVGRVKSFFGGGEKEQGNAETGEMANGYYKDFKHYVGTQGLAGKSMIEAQVLIDWMNGRGFDASVVQKQPQDLISPKEAAEMILVGSRKKKRLGQAPAAPTTSPTQAPPATPKPAPSDSNTKLIDILTTLSATDRAKLISYLK